MGGLVAYTAASLLGDRLAGVQLVDSPILESTREETAARQHRAFGPLRVYQDRETALSRFHLIPEQDATLPYVLGHIAATSLREVEGGWSWKFDPAVFAHERSDLASVARVACRVAFFYAQRGLVAPELVRKLPALLGPDALVAEIPMASHHVMIDQPLALVRAIRSALASWDCG